MVEAHRVHGVEAREVVLVGMVVAVPRDHVERRVVVARGPEVPAEAQHDVGGRFAILVCRHGDREIARAGEAVGADRPQLGKPEGRAVVLAHVAARGFTCELDAQAHAARNHRDLARRHGEPSQLGREHQGALLRHDEQLAVRIAQHALHRAVGGVGVDAGAALRARISRGGDGRQPVEEIRGLPGHRRRRPAQAIRRGLGLGARSAAQPAVADAAEGGMRCRGPQAIEPRAQVLRARRRERGAGKLLGIEAERDLARRVAPDGQRALERLGLVVGAKPERYLMPLPIARSFMKIGLDRRGHYRHSSALPLIGSRPGPARPRVR